MMTIASASTNTNDSFDGDGDRTINVTGLIRRASMAATTDADSTMEVTGDYGAGIVEQAGRLSVAPVHPSSSSGTGSIQQSTEPVFSAPAPVPLSPSKSKALTTHQLPLNLTRIRSPKPFRFHIHTQIPIPRNACPVVVAIESPSHKDKDTHTRVFLSAPAAHTVVPEEKICSRRR